MPNLKKYKAIVNGYETTLILSDEDAELGGFTEPIDEYSTPELVANDPGTAVVASVPVTAPAKATKPARRPAKKAATRKKAEPKPPNKAAPVPAEKQAPAAGTPEELAAKIESA